MTEEGTRWLASKEREQQAREQWLDSTRELLAGKQKQALYENPYQPFRTRLEVEAFSHLSRNEIEQLQAAERQAYERHQPIAQERVRARSAFIAAGGDEQLFDAYWESQGELDFVVERAIGIQRRGQQSSVF